MVLEHGEGEEEEGLAQSPTAEPASFAGAPQDTAGLVPERAPV